MEVNFLKIYNQLKIILQNHQKLTKEQRSQYQLIKDQVHKIDYELWLNDLKRKRY